MLISIAGCIDYEENIVNKLPDNKFSEANPCSGSTNAASFIKFDKDVGWVNCHASNSLTIDFGKKLTVTMLKVAGSVVNGVKRIVTKFKVRYSQDQVVWENIIRYSSHEYVRLFLFS